MRNLRDEFRLAYTLYLSCLKKLSLNRDKKHWKHETQEDLIRMLKEEVKELLEALDQKELAIVVWDEAADIANFAAMIADNYENKE